MRVRDVERKKIKYVREEEIKISKKKREEFEIRRRIGTSETHSLLRKRERIMEMKFWKANEIRRKKNGNKKRQNITY